MPHAREPYLGGSVRDRAKRDRLAQLWSAGASVADIAQQLHTSPGAVRTMVSRMRQEGVELEYRSRPHTLEELQARLAAAVASGERSGRGNTRRVQILELRVEGLSDPEIAARLSCKLAFVRQVVADPDGARARTRRHRRRQVCARCNEPVINYTNRIEPLCRLCAAKDARPHEWDHDLIRDAILQEARRIGRTPPLSWVKRGEAPFSIGTLQRVFGRNPWRQACRYSGLPARPTGGVSALEEKAYELRQAP